MVDLIGRIQEQADGASVGEAVAITEVVARLEQGEALAEVGRALGLDPLDLVAALAWAGLGAEGDLGPTLTQVPPARPNLIPALGERSLAKVFPAAPRTARLALAAGLLQIHDAWGPSHEAAQEADDLGESAVSAFWHAVAHRREPDPGNALYWFRRLGRSHPVFGPLAAATRPLVDAYGDPGLASRLFDRGTWNPPAMVEFCAQTRPGTPAASLARRIQRREMQALLDLTVESLL